MKFNQCWGGTRDATQIHFVAVARCHTHPKTLQVNMHKIHSQKNGNQIKEAIVLCRVCVNGSGPDGKRSEQKLNFCETMYWIWRNCDLGVNTRESHKLWFLTCITFLFEWRLFFLGSTVQRVSECVCVLDGGEHVCENAWRVQLCAVKMPMCCLHTFSPYHHNKITYWL